MEYDMLISSVLNRLFGLKRVNLLDKMLVTIENEGGWGEAQVAASRPISIHNNARQIGKNSYFKRLFVLVLNDCAFLGDLIARSVIVV